MKPSGNEVLAYCQLASFGTWNPGTGVYDECRPALGTLAERAGMSESNLRRALRALLEKGAIVAGGARYDAKGGQLPTVYRVIFGVLAPPGGVPPVTGGGAARDRGGVPPVAPNQEPSTKNQHQEVLDADAPSAQTILKLFLDYLAAQGITTLHGQTKARLGKEIKAAIDGKVPEKLIRHALHLLYLKGKIGNPSLLPHLIIEVQQAKPVSGPPASKPFVQQADEYKSRKARAEKAHGLLVDHLMETEGKSLAEALAEADEAKRAYLAQEPVASSSSVAYIEGVILPEDPKEVTGS
jgi:DNA-binding Lrp family transcriptional regulator